MALVGGKDGWSMTVSSEVDGGRWCVQVPDSMADEAFRLFETREPFVLREAS